MNILITGARAPVALELVRRFGRAGHTVDLVDSVAWPLAAFSRFCRAYHRLPPPRQQTADYGRDMRALVSHYDLVIPTCEDVLWLSQEADGFCPELQVLRRLHNKWLFTELAAELGHLTPTTRLLTSRREALEILATGAPLVLKPVYSRFAAHTLINPQTPDQIPSWKGAWVAQDYWEGQAFCSFSVAHQGRLTAHVVYKPLVTLGQGAGVVIESVAHSKIDTWVREFLSPQGLTGQFAFDFIEDSSGRVACLECNPRTTSGVHLFEADGRLVESYLDPRAGCLSPPSGRRAMLTLPALFSDPLAVMRSRPKPVVMELQDWKPNFGQALSFLEVWLLSFKVGFLEATTYDICWDETSTPTAN